MRKWSLLITAAALVMAIGWAGRQAPGQVAASAPATAKAGASLEKSWEDLLHYINIVRPDVALSCAQAILNSNPKPKAVYEATIKFPRTGPTLARGRNVNKRLAAAIDKITLLIDQGAKDVRTDPDEIARWITMLGGAPRAVEIASKRLIHSGEYAVPQLIATLGRVKTSAALRERIISVLPRMGKDAVRPLTEVLATKDPAVKEVVARALGKIGYPHATAYLAELAEQKGLLASTRRAARGGVAACGGDKALSLSVATLFYQLAEKYYRRDESVGPDSRYDTANVWTWDDKGGLKFVEVPTAIFHEIYTMRMAQKVLQHDPKFDSAIPLWIAANYRREALLPKGAADPTYPATKPPPAYYGKAAGAQYLQEVLRRALADKDVAVAIAAIEALSGTTGAKNLVAGAQGEPAPLIRALTCSSRLVRYMAAETLANARPDKAFAGSDQVMGVLTEALRASGKPSVVLVDPEAARRNKVKDLLRAAGAEVHGSASFGTALASGRDAGGVDVVVIASNITRPGPVEAVASLRGRGVLATVPVVIVEHPRTAAGRTLAKTDPYTVLIAEDQLTGPGLAQAMAAARAKAAGGTVLTAKDAADWSIRAARCFRMLAVTANAVYDLGGATGSLIAALADARDAVRIAAASALGAFPAPAAQQAIAGLAGDAKASEAVRLAAYAAASESVRVFGNQLTGNQVDAVIAVVGGAGSLKIREAAAGLLGALDVPSDKIKALILSRG